MQQRGCSGACTCPGQKGSDCRCTSRASPLFPHSCCSYSSSAPVTKRALVFVFVEHEHASSEDPPTHRDLMAAVTPPRGPQVTCCSSHGPPEAPEPLWPPWPPPASAPAPRASEYAVKGFGLLECLALFRRSATVMSSSTTGRCCVMQRDQLCQAVAAVIGGLLHPAPPPRDNGARCSRSHACLSPANC